MNAAATPATAGFRTDGASHARRAFWLKQLHQWHWVSSAICLVGMLLFAVTGVTLNHAAAIESQPDTTTRQAALPPTLVEALEPAPARDDASVPAAVAAHVARTLSIDIASRPAEWSADEVYVALPRPGGDAFLTIDRATGAIEYERTDRGWISYLNDLHKGRNTGTAWTWFLDIFAGGCVVFCLTGLFLLQMHARQRPTTWPMVGLGVVVPVVIALLLIH